MYQRDKQKKQFTYKIRTLKSQISFLVICKKKKNGNREQNKIDVIRK